MQTKEYIVRKTPGVRWNGQLIPPGETIVTGNGGAIKAYLHFNQVAEAPAGPDSAAAADDSDKPVSGKRSRP